MAYWQLLLASAVVTGYCAPLAGQTQDRQPLGLHAPDRCNAALPGFSAQIGTPAAAPKPAGKGLGRPAGFIPQPRPRYPIIVKGRKARKWLLRPSPRRHRSFDDSLAEVLPAISALRHAGPCYKLKV